MPPNISRFAEYELDRSAYQLRRKGRPVQLERIPLDLLFLLIDRGGHLVTREEIFESIWGKNFFLDVDNAINAAVRKIRRALRDDPEAPRFVMTVPTKGYRFVAAVHEAKSQARYSDETSVRSTQSSIVGRERELASLLSGLDEAAAGRGRLMFLVSGEPGIGKTRLADEIAAVAETRGLAVLLGHCFEEEAVPFLPFVEMLERFVERIREPEQLRRELAEEGPELARLLPKLRRILPDLPPPLDLPPAQARRHLFNCFFDFAARVASQQPTLMVVEDLHWADDDSTLSLLDHLARRLSDVPLMLLGTYRDAEAGLSRGLAKTLEDLLRGRPATRVKLKGLPRDEVATMLNGLSGKSTPGAVVGEIFAETEGNPFFVEELFRHLEEENRLYDSSGQFRSELKIADLEAPPSVRLVVARRLARLSDLTQKMLATAAVIGRFFSFEILQASSAADADSILECVEEAEKAGLVFSVAESPKARFEFSHELTRQAVIGGLSAARRQKLHLEVAGAIERSCSATLADYYGELAHHYRLGGNLAKAIAYLVQAARQAVARSAPQQAIVLATTGLELLAAVPNDEQHDRDELALQMTLGNCASITRGWAAPEAERAYARALELCGRTDLTPAAIRALTGLYTYYSRGANYHRASALQVQLLELAPALAEPQLRAVIHYSVGFRLLYHGDFEAARNQLEQAIRWSAGHRRHVHACAAMALTLWNLGYPAQASKLIKEAGTEGRKLHDPYAEVMVADNACMVHLVSKDAPGAKLYADDVTNISTKYGFAGEIAVASIVHAWADGWGGDPKGIDLLRESLVEFAAAEGELSRSWLCGLIAELCLKFGRNDEAVAALEEAIGVIARTGEGFAESEIYRLKGEAELQLGHSDIGSAAKWFERAIDAARKRSARIAELRATSNLARLLAKQHMRDKARVMLSEIYDWFTEGFDTPDLKDAKALLDELNR